jgi:Flp pilus assembly protein TadG
MLEFAMVAPVFLALLFTIFGAGINGFYQYSLDEALRYAARQLQINGPASLSGSAFVAAVCAKFGSLASNCSSTLTYDVQSATYPGGFTSLTPAALPTSGNFGNSFMTGAAPAMGVAVLAQVAYPIPFAIPFNKYLTGTGSPTIMAVTTVLVEPQ